MLYPVCTIVMAMSLCLHQPAPSVMANMHSLVSPLQIVARSCLNFSFKNFTCSASSCLGADSFGCVTVSVFQQSLRTQVNGEEADCCGCEFCGFPFDARSTHSMSHTLKVSQCLLVSQEMQILAGKPCDSLTHFPVD